MRSSITFNFASTIIFPRYEDIFKLDLKKFCKLSNFISLKLKIALYLLHNNFKMARNILFRIKASMPNVQQTIKYISQYRLENPNNPHDHDLNMVVIYLKNNNIEEATRILDTI
jgi:hypothetical protein